ncbi:hypothetical protein [Nocardia sp. NBC_01327]|uniref:hypothetical protein n=1 Tax=Nocardia sp. NBC_01327 TaxID=2903593 RepID=UPI002E101800|nr:hypothetical protein OG326_23685 [Nocardia sp. NBC_01327]
MSIEGFAAACELIEKNMLEAIERVATDLTVNLCLPAEVRDQIHAVLAPYVSDCAVVLATSLAAGETAEQFEARLAALKIEES